MSIDNRCRRQLEKILRQIEQPIPKKKNRFSVRDMSNQNNDLNTNRDFGGENDDDVIVVIRDDPIPTKLTPDPSAATSIRKVVRRSSNSRSSLDKRTHAYSCEAHAFESHVYVTYLRHIAQMHDDFTKINREMAQDGSCPITFKDNHYMCQGKIIRWL